MTSIQTTEQPGSMAEQAQPESVPMADFRNSCTARQQEIGQLLIQAKGEKSEAEELAAALDSRVKGLTAEYNQLVGKIDVIDRSRAPEVQEPAA